MDNIIKRLCLEDPDLEILDVSVHGRTKEITMARTLRPQFCPICQSRMYSRGIYQRTGTSCSTRGMRAVRMPPLLKSRS